MTLLSLSFQFKIQCGTVYCVPFTLYPVVCTSFSLQCVPECLVCSAYCVLCRLCILCKGCFFDILFLLCSVQCVLFQYVLCTLSVQCVYVVCSVYLHSTQYTCVSLAGMGLQSPRKVLNEKNLHFRKSSKYAEICGELHEQKVNYLIFPIKQKNFSNGCLEQLEGLKSTKSELLRALHTT